MDTHEENEDVFAGEISEDALPEAEDDIEDLEAAGLDPELIEKKLRDKDLDDPENTVSLDDEAEEELDVEEETFDDIYDK